MAKPPAGSPMRPAPDRPEAEQIARSVGRTVARRQRCRVKVSDGKGGVRLDIPHNDRNGGSARIMDVFGTTSPEFVGRITQQIATLSVPFGGQQPSGEVINAVLAFVDGLEPANEAEAMAAVMLYATNDLALSVLARAKRAETAPELQLMGNLAAKLTRAATAQMEALAKLRRGGEQTVRVEHVHVHAGGQAIVGNVTRGVGGNGLLEDQSHEPFISGASLASVLGIDAARDAVPIASDAERALPNPRRNEPRRSRGQS